ncbi:MAG: succinyl-diaminopimelate desuccinylase [Gammaproteobacteria bacterium]
MTPTLELACDLIRRPSLTPDQAGCIDLIAARLEKIGFVCEQMRFGNTDNLWARRGTTGPVLALAGHVDVVPPGDLAQWQTPPFEPLVQDGWLHGRGAADMKGGLAGLVTAAERFVAAHPDHNGTLAFLITADEEGIGSDGTVRVVDALTERGDTIDWCVLGEPSSKARAGDQLRNGRRGSLTGRLTVHGVQGHVAFPELIDNPVHRVTPVLAELCAIEWDRGNAHFPPTSLQVVTLEAGSRGVDNVVPASAHIVFNLRFSTEQTVDSIEARVAALLNRHGFQYDIEWHISGLPFLTEGGPLIDATIAAVTEVVGITPELSTAGGTSDGRHIAPAGAQVIELGPVNATIHKLNERVRAAELDELSAVYERILEKLLV